MVRYLHTSSRHNGCRDTTSLTILSGKPDPKGLKSEEYKAKRKARAKKKGPKKRKISPLSNPLNDPLIGKRRKK